MLTKEDILTCSDIKTEVVEVPEWGGSVRVRMMTGSDRDAFEQSMVTNDGGKRETDMSNYRAKLVALTMIDDSGQRMFGIEEIALLGNKSAAALSRVFNAAQKLNSLDGASVEEAAKN